MSAFAIVLGIVFSFSRKRLARIFTVLGLLGGAVVFCVRLYDPRGMNLRLMWFNRWLVVWIAGVSAVCLAFVVLSWLTRQKVVRLACESALSVMVCVSLVYLVPPVMQYTREFVYFGESGISTSSLLRALGFALGIIVCLLLVLSSYEVHRSLRSEGEGYMFLFASVLVYSCEYLAGALAAMQRLKFLKIGDALFGVSVFDVMIWRGANPNAFLFGQLGLGLAMLGFVIWTHRQPEGTFANRALLRKEKARLRDCRRW